MDFDFVIVGGSAAGYSALGAIERLRPDARTVIIDRGTEPPHDKPALSKQLLSREQADDTAYLRPPDQWHGDRSVLRLDETAVALENHVVRLRSGEALSGSAIVLAPGCRPRTIDLVEGASNAVSLRSLSDLRRLRDLATPDARVVLVGGGFIGMEVASSLLGRVGSITVVERAALPLERVVGEDPARWLLQRPVDAGIAMRTTADIAAAERDANGAVTSVTLSSGEVLGVDLLVVGVGVVPDVEWLAGGDVTLTNGIAVDEFLQTSVPGVFAAGDAVEFPDVRTGRRNRIEHWTNAIEQGRRAGENAVAAAAGDDLAPFSAVPYVWSDQYGNKVQMAGYTRWADEVAVRMATDRQLFAEYFDHGELCAVLAVNMPREVMTARKHLATVGSAA